MEVQNIHEMLFIELHTKWKYCHRKELKNAIHGYIIS